MEILSLIDKSNKMFELVEYIDYYDEYDEIVSLKISINNLLEKYAKDEGTFMELMLLSSPVLFDFAFNSKIDNKGRRLRTKFETSTNYYDAKKWYKFIRNCLIHTNRYTYNNFLKSVYRIEYNETVDIYLLIDDRKYDKYVKFTNNKYFIANDKANKKQNIASTYVYNSDVRMVINCTYFRQFILEIVCQFINAFESDIDKLLKEQISKWQNYFKMYRKMIKSIYITNKIDLKILTKLLNYFNIFKNVNINESYILCEYLLYFKAIKYKVNPQHLDEIIEITTFDKFQKLQNRQFLLNELKKVEGKTDLVIKKQQVLNLLSKVYDENELRKLTITPHHTNYLIVYTQKYIRLRGALANE